MKKTLWIGFAIAVTAPLNVTAQDASSVIDASTKAMGATMLESIRYTGTGTNNSVGQAFTSGGSFASTMNFRREAAARVGSIRLLGRAASVRFRATSSKTKIPTGVQRLDLSTF